MKRDSWRALGTMGNEIGRHLTVDSPPRTSSCAKVEYEAGIVHHDAPETGGAEPGSSEILLYVSQQLVLHRHRLALHRSCYVPYSSRFCLG